MSFDDDDTSEAHERRIVRCRDTSCNAKIIFLPSASTGKSVPVDADTVEAADDEFDAKRHVAHFATCKSPGAFRKPRQ